MIWQWLIVGLCVTLAAGYLLRAAWVRRTACGGGCCPKDTVAYPPTSGIELNLRRRADATRLSDQVP